MVDIGNAAYQREFAKPAIESQGWRLDDQNSRSFNCEWPLQGDAADIAALQASIQHTRVFSMASLENITQKYYVLVGLYTLMVALRTHPLEHTWKHSVGIVASSLSVERWRRCHRYLKPPAPTNVSAAMVVTSLYPVAFNAYQHGNGAVCKVERLRLSSVASRSRL